MRMMVNMTRVKRLAFLTPLAAALDTIVFIQCCFGSLSLIPDNVMGASVRSADILTLNCPKMKFGEAANGSSELFVNQ